MQTVQTPATSVPATDNPGHQYDGIPPFLQREKPAKIPYAGKESPEETRALKAETAVVLCKAIKEAKAPKAVKATAVKPKTKLAIVAALLLRKDGTTNAEILAATGWPSVTVPGQAKAAGLTLRKEKTPGKPTRYFGSK